MNNGVTVSSVQHKIQPQKTYQQNLKAIQKHLGKKGKLSDAVNPTMWHKADVKSFLGSRNKRLRPPTIRKKQLERGIKPMLPSGLSWKDVNLVGADTESAYNDAIKYPGRESITTLLQLHHPSHGGKCFRNPPMDESIFSFMEEKYPEVFQEGKTTVFLFHNLNFDITQLFGNDYKKLFYTNNIHVKKSVLSNQSFILMKYKHYDVTFLDTSNFFPTSLANASAENGLGYPKLPTPSWIGEYPANAAQWAELEKYGLIDANIAYDLGVLIQASQEALNVGGCLTIAEVARKDFCTNYLQHPIQYPPLDMCDYMVKGKHGAIICAFKRGFDFTRKYCYYDVNGLYTWVMMNSPYPFSIGRTRSYEVYGIKEVLNEEYEGIGTVQFRFPKKKKYPCLPVKMNKLYFPSSGISHCTFSEIRLAKKLGARITLLHSTGWHIDPELDYNSPLAKYATKNAALKDEMSSIMESIKEEYIKRALETGIEITEDVKDDLKAKYSTTLEYKQAAMNRKNAKDGNNTIYGKSGQITNDVAGALYHPMFAAITLGHARVKMFTYLADCEKLGIDVAYIDTDCLICLEGSLPPEWLSQTETGLLKSETEESFHLLIVRSKFYFCVSESGKILKCGHHAIRFERNKTQLEKEGNDYMNAERLLKQILKGDDYVIKYSKRHFTKPRESLKVGKFPNKIEERELTLSLAEDNKREYNKNAKDTSDIRTHWISSKPLARV